MNLAIATAGKDKQMSDERLEDSRQSPSKVSDDGGREDSDRLPLARIHGMEQTGTSETKTVSSEGGSVSLLTSHKDIDDIENIPHFVQEHSATLSFPEKLMLMLTHVERECAKSGADVDEACICWILEGRAFAIRNKQVLVDTILPMIFRKAKFPSFTRKLYRWGFRQVSITAERVGQRQELIFGHENFQRNNKQLMTKMRSVTAAGTRRAIAALAVKQQSAANRLSVMAANSSSNHETVTLPVDAAMKSMSDFAASSLQQQPSLTMISNNAVNRLGVLSNPMIHSAMAAAIAAAQQQHQLNGSALFNPNFVGQTQSGLSHQYLANLSALALRTLQPEANEATNNATSDANAVAPAPTGDRLHAAVDLLLRFATP